MPSGQVSHEPLRQPRPAPWSDAGAAGGMAPNGWTAACCEVRSDGLCPGDVMCAVQCGVHHLAPPYHSRGRNPLPVATQCTYQVAANTHPSPWHPVRLPPTPTPPPIAIRRTRARAYLGQYLINHPPAPVAPSPSRRNAAPGHLLIGCGHVGRVEHLACVCGRACMRVQGGGDGVENMGHMWVVHGNTLAWCVGRRVAEHSSGASEVLTHA